MAKGPGFGFGPKPRMTDPAIPPSLHGGLTAKTKSKTIRIPINLLAVNVLELMAYLKVLGRLSSELTAKVSNHLGLPSAVA